MASTEEVLSVPTPDNSTLKHNTKTYGNMRLGMESHERKSLQTLQQSALDEKALVGVGIIHAGNNGRPGEKMKIQQVHGPVKVFFDHSTPKMTKDDRKAASTHTTFTQTDDSLLEILIQERLTQRRQDMSVKRDHSFVGSEEDEAYQLMIKEPVPDSYWEQIAEQRRLALNDTLEENRSLHEGMDSLREENEKLSELASQAASLSSLLQSVVSDDEGNDLEVQNSSKAPAESEHLNAEAIENEKCGIHNQESTDQACPEISEYSINSESLTVPKLNAAYERTDSTVNK